MAIWAAARTASSRNGTTAISSTDAVPPSLWPALLTVLGDTGQPSQGNAHAWRAKAHNQVGTVLRQYVFASIQTRQIAAIEAPRRRIQTRVPPPLANSLSVPAISSAIMPKAA